MRKRARKLELHRETVRRLTDRGLDYQVLAVGNPTGTNECTSREGCTVDSCGWCSYRIC